MMKKVIFFVMVLSIVSINSIFALTDYVSEKGVWSNIPALINGFSKTGRMECFPENAVNREIGVIINPHYSGQLYFAEVILPTPRKITLISMDGVFFGYRLYLLPAVEDTGDAHTILNSVDSSFEGYNKERSEWNHSVSFQVQHFIVLAPAIVVQGQVMTPLLYAVALYGDDQKDYGRALSPDALEKSSVSYEMHKGTAFKDFLTKPFNNANVDKVQKNPLFSSHRELVREQGVGAWFGSGDEFGLSFKTWYADIGDEFRLQMVGELGKFDTNNFGVIAQYRSTKRLANFAEDVFVKGGAFFPYGALGLALGFSQESSGDESSTVWAYGADATVGLSFTYKPFEINLDLVGFGYHSGSLNQGFNRASPTLSILYYWK
jgi:hypothetical protein